MIVLDDCGKKLHMSSGYVFTSDMMDVTVSMVIKAPRGIMALFYHEPLKYYWSNYSYPLQEMQGRAIKAFMEGHQND